MPLTSPQQKYLRGLTHQLHPVVMVGDKGLSTSVMTEIEQALSHHELVKVKLRGEKADREAWIETITSTTGAELVHGIGQVACFFRRNPEQPRIALPG